MNNAMYNKKALDQTYAQSYVNTDIGALYFTTKLLLYICQCFPKSFLLNTNYQSVVIPAQNNFQGISK